MIVTRDLGATAGRRVLQAVREVLADRPRCLLAVPGGTTPGPVFAWLAQHLPASMAARLDLVPVDERHLPLPGGPPARWQDLPADSNARRIHAEWLAHSLAPPTLLPLDAPGPLDQALQAVAAALPGDPDVALLGLGPDAHVASLFPGHPALGSPDRLIAVHDSPKPPPERISFGLASLARARAVIVLATGQAKAEAVRRCAAREPGLPLTALPAAVWVLDPDAASLLPGPPAPPPESP